MIYDKLKGRRGGMWNELVLQFIQLFPHARVPSIPAVRKMYNKHETKFTLHNCNSASSPGDTNSGRPRTTRTGWNTRRVKNVMDRDARKDIKEIGRDTSPLSSARRNTLGIDKTAWISIKKDIKYHAYKVERTQELNAVDPARRINFCNWLLTHTDEQLSQFCFSDEANFDLSGHVNSQNVRMYAPNKFYNPQGGRPKQFKSEKKVTKKIMVFAGIKMDGTFGFHIF